MNAYGSWKLGREGARAEYSFEVLNTEQLASYASKNC